MRKIITVYNLLIFVGLDLVCIKCDQFIHPVKDEVYEIFLKLCKAEFSVSVADLSKVLKTWFLVILKYNVRNRHIANRRGVKDLQNTTFEAPVSLKSRYLKCLLIALFLSYKFTLYLKLKVTSFWIRTWLIMEKLHSSAFLVFRIF